MTEKMTGNLIPGGNRILVGAKTIEAYVFAVLMAFDDNFASVILEGLGKQGEKSIRVAKDIVALQPDISILRIESITRSSPNFGRVKGVQVILVKKIPSPEAKASTAASEEPQEGTDKALARSE